ncbi:exonuclease SbcCD subunit D [Candidatus Woesearchaeota archaeon]|nr:exonuclease SbcCD subunit D [Candidatus Woesearchaeota archaeon]
MKSLKFAHLADCHIGSWRDPKLKDIPVKAFIKAMDLCISKQVDFILLSGDLFNTSLPSVDSLKETVIKLKELKDKKIPLYLIAGSHDFSPSGKTMLDVLEKAGLFRNVAKAKVIDEKLKLRFTVDKKTGAKITGLLGKKGGLEKEYYKNLMKEHLESEQGYKIFMFHSALTEFKPEDLKDMDSQPLSLLPKNFNYYAGGHVHYRFNKQEPDYGLIAFPGPLFPNNFKELEDLERGSLYIAEVQDGKTSIELEPIQIHNIHKISIEADNKTPAQIEEEISKAVEGKEFNNTIITLRIEGTLLSGKPTDINFKEIFEKLYNKSAYFVMKNISKLTTKEFEEIKIEKGSADEVETKLIKEHLGQIKVAGMDADKEENLIKDLMDTLSIEKADGETVATFETRLKSEIDNILELD